MLWYTATAPAGYLICDGTAISRADYAKLYSVIGTTYGTGNGSTTFNLPDLRQRFPMGKAASGTGNALAATGGAVDHTHTSAAHTHTVPAHYHSMGSGADFLAASGVPKFIPTGGSYTLGSAGTNYRDMQSGDASGKIGLVTGGVDGNASMTSGSTTPSATGSNNPPFVVVNYIIKHA